MPWSLWSVGHRSLEAGSRYGDVGMAPRARRHRIFLRISGRKPIAKPQRRVMDGLFRGFRFWGAVALAQPSCSPARHEGAPFLAMPPLRVEFARCSGEVSAGEISVAIRPSTNTGCGWAALRGNTDFALVLVDSSDSQLSIRRGFGPAEIANLSLLSMIDSTVVAFDAGRQALILVGGEGKIADRRRQFRTPPPWASIVSKESIAWLEVYHGNLRLVTSDAPVGLPSLDIPIEWGDIAPSVPSAIIDSSALIALRPGDGCLFVISIHSLGSPKALGCLPPSLVGSASPVRATTSTGSLVTAISATVLQLVAISDTALIAHVRADDGAATTLYIDFRRHQVRKLVEVAASGGVIPVRSMRWAVGRTDLLATDGEGIFAARVRP